jgi:hypothetical protein
VLETTFGVGLTRRTATQLILTPYVHEREGSSTKSGFGDLALRLQVNFWGNDPEPGEKTAFALIPEMTIPTGTQTSVSKVEGGITEVFAWNPFEHLSLGSHLQFEFSYDGDRRRHDTSFVHTAKLSTDVLRVVELQFEYVGTAAVTGGQKYQPMIGVAAAVPLGKNLQLDTDVRVGFGSSNYDWGGRAQTGRVTVSTGFTYRY